jgi:hypothetical protein
MKGKYSLSTRSRHLKVRGYAGRGSAVRADGVARSRLYPRSIVISLLHFRAFDLSIASSNRFSIRVFSDLSIHFRERFRFAIESPFAPLQRLSNLALLSSITPLIKCALQIDFMRVTFLACSGCRTSCR